MTTDIKEPATIGPTHQLPEHVPARRRHAIVWVVMSTLLLLVLALVIVLVLRHRRERRKSGGCGTPCAGDHRYQRDGSKR